MRIASSFPSSFAKSERPPMAPTPRCPVLPDEIMEDEIFARLPAKSVLACRCLSRAWAAALSSEDFTDWYHAIHGGRPKIFRLQDSSDGDEEEDDVPIAVTGACLPRLITVFWDDEDPLDRPTHPSLASTQCRGLVILEHVPTGIHFLCNPSTGQKRAIPEGRTTGCRLPLDVMQRYASLGLGYDARARRHKVVRVYYRGRDGEGRPASVGCEVYVVNDRDGSTESWRPIAASPEGWVKQFKPSVFAQGHVYWSGHRTLDDRFEEIGTIIICFSVCEETFATVPAPPGIQVEVLRKWRFLTELAGRLCLFSGHEHQYDVWLLRGHGPGTVWDLHCRIEAGTASPAVNRVMRGRYDSYQNNMIPLALMDNGRSILLTQTDWPKDIWAYTPSSGDIEKLIDLESLVHRNNWLLEVAVYEESTARLGRQPRGDIVVLASSLSTQAMSLVLRLLSERTLRRLMCVCRSWQNMIASELWCSEYTHAR
ncbi:F-box protein CPR1-like [Aegilops tauschii subsp. strangulata]|uniref:F-box protein CPR1-like n=1 Tax=Aegilops tauschii subsp. strangulata TaxID=200361 RepID=UPI000842B52C